MLLVQLSELGLALLVLDEPLHRARDSIAHDYFGANAGPVNCCSERDAGADGSQARKLR